LPKLSAADEHVLHMGDAARKRQRKCNTQEETIRDIPHFMKNLPEMLPALSNAD
jgi:predicted protein tyrosine phosphatase